MSDANTPAAGTTATAAPETPAIVAPQGAAAEGKPTEAPRAQADDSNVVRMAPDVLKARLAEEREKGEKAAAKALAAELGVSPAEAKEMIAEGKRLRDEKLSEAERKDKRIAELEKEIVTRTEATRREAIKPFVESRLAALTEGQRTAIVAAAGDDPVAQAKMLDVMSAFIPKAAAAQVEQPKAPIAPAVTTAPPAAASAPKPGDAQTIDHRAEYERLRGISPQYARFYIGEHPEALVPRAS